MGHKCWYPLSDAQPDMRNPIRTLSQAHKLNAKEFLKGVFMSEGRLGQCLASPTPPIACMAPSTCLLRALQGQTLSVLRGARLKEAPDALLGDAQPGHSAGVAVDHVLVGAPLVASVARLPAVVRDVDVEGLDLHTLNAGLRSAIRKSALSEVLALGCAGSALSFQSCNPAFAQLRCLILAVLSTLQDCCLKCWRTQWRSRCTTGTRLNN